jgi:hypothetical protein
MRYAAKGGGLPAAAFNMSRTDAAGIAIFVCAAIFIAVLVKILSE